MWNFSALTHQLPWEPSVTGQPHSLRCWGDWFCHLFFLAAEAWGDGRYSCTFIRDSRVHVPQIRLFQNSSLHLMSVGGIEVSIVVTDVISNFIAFLGVSWLKEICHVPPVPPTGRACYNETPEMMVNLQTNHFKCFWLHQSGVNVDNYQTFGR